MIARSWYKGVVHPMTILKARIPLLCVLVACCVSCTVYRVQHPDFVRANVALLRPGMTPEEVRDLFGDPDDERVMECGSESPDPWQCLVWTYSLTGGYTNLMVFDADVTPPRLDSWLLGRVYDKERSTSPPASTRP